MNKNLFLVTIFTILSMVCGTANAQYQIKIHIDNLADSTIYLGYYFGDKQYVKDTVVLDKKANGVFEGKDSLPGGIYFIVVPGNMMFELIVDKDQKFSLSTKYSKNPVDLTKWLKVSGSDDMQIYIDYQQYMTHQGELAMGLRKRLKNTSNTEKETKEIQDSLNLLNDQVQAKWKEIEEKYPKSLIASVLFCIKEIDIPEPPRDSNGVITDSMFQYRYYKKHYFDYVDFSDERLLRTQFYHPKIDRYFDKLVVPAPDSVIKESKMVLEKASANPEVFKYTLQIIFNKYNNSEIMGMDKVFVFLAENYYLNGKANWTDTTWLKKVQERVDELKPNLIGEQAPELKLIGYDNSLVSLYMINADYTVLFFFEPSCGHCKKATPKMKVLSDKYMDKGVVVLGIYTQVDHEEWKKFIEEQHLENWINAWDPYNQSHFRDNYDVRSTPTIYLLDKDKKIIGKRIDVETLEKMLEDEFKKKEKK